MGNEFKLGLIFCVALISGMVLPSILRLGYISKGIDTTQEQESAPIISATDSTLRPRAIGGCCGSNLRQGIDITQGQNSAPVISAGNSTQPIDVGNKICPVSGNPIGVMGPGVQEEYNGKIYHLCCGGCIRRFENDPARYAKIAEDEVKGQ